MELRQGCDAAREGQSVRKHERRLPSISCRLRVQGAQRGLQQYSDLFRKCEELLGRFREDEADVSTMTESESIQTPGVCKDRVVQTSTNQTCDATTQTTSGSEGNFFGSWKDHVTLKKAFSKWRNRWKTLRRACSVLNRKRTQFAFNQWFLCIMDRTRVPCDYVRENFRAFSDKTSSTIKVKRISNPTFHDDPGKMVEFRIHDCFELLNRGKRREKKAFELWKDDEIILTNSFKKIENHRSSLTFWN